MVKLKTLTLRQNAAFTRLSRESQQKIWGGTGSPTFPYTPTPYVCPCDKTSVTRPIVPTYYPIG
jgi:hypothetical protein